MVGTVFDIFRLETLSFLTFSYPSIVVDPTKKKAPPGKKVSLLNSMSTALCYNYAFYLLIGGGFFLCST